MWSGVIFIILLIVLVYASDLVKEYYPELFGVKTATSPKKPVNAQNTVSYAGGKWHLRQQENQVVATLSGENPDSKHALPVLQVGCWNQKPFAYLQFSTPQPNGSVPVRISFDNTPFQPSVLEVGLDYRSYLSPAGHYLTWFQQGKRLIVD